jgi:23S rRNA G2445 N2-methylase RlmL
MLGVSSLGIDYTGYDIRQETIDESNNMINFLNLKNVRMFQQDTLNVKDEKEYDLLITCPPYGKGVERWDNETKILDTTDEYVEKILNNFNAKVYLFIVDKTAKFKDNIIDNVHQRSHFQNTDELILKFIKKC